MIGAAYMSIEQNKDDYLFIGTFNARPKIKVS